jgi:methyl-accepting chemotaxis protein
MKNLNLPISRKLPIVIVALAALTAVASGILSYNKSETQSITAAQNKLSALVEARTASLSSYLDSIRQDLVTLASSHMTMQALSEFETGYQTFGDGVTANLQKLYITDNPHALGEKHKQDLASDGSAYSASHGAYHPWFRQFLEARGYYDIFLINKGGDVVYSVFKELDYATNLMRGQWRDSDLGNVFRQADMNKTPGSVSFFDFSPYAPSANAPASFIATPIFDYAGIYAGVLVFQMPIANINAVMQQAEGMGESGETYIVGEDFLMRSDSRFSEESTILKTKIEGATVRNAIAGESGVEAVNDYRGIPVFSAYKPLHFEGTKWAILGEQDEEEVLAPVAEMRNFLAIAGVLLLAAIAAIGAFFARSITRPLSNLTGAMAALAKGDHDVAVPALGRTDEIGELAATMEVFKENSAEMKRLEAEEAVAKEAAEKERLAREEEDRAREAKAEENRLAAEKKAEEDRRTMMLELADDFENSVRGVVDQLSNGANELQATASSMSATAEETTRQASTVAVNTEQASSNVQMVAAATEELSSSINEISRQVSESTSIAQNAVDEAERTNVSVKSLADCADKIVDVVTLINDIASQTNLLALNATIEAARAGEAGKGFAVVASEVKNLASQTGKATEDIAALINEIRNASSEAVGAIGEIGSTIGSIHEITTTIASAVEEQNSATGEISRNVQEAASGTQQVSENIEGITKASQDTGSAAEQVLSAANEMSSHSDALGEQVEKFLQQVRNG